MQRLLIVVPMKKVFWIMLAALVIASGAWAQGTVTRGPLEFTFNGDIAGPTAGNANLLWNGVDQLHQLWFWYRCVGDPFETPLPVPDDQVYDQANGIVFLTWNNICGAGLQGLVFLRDCSSDFCSLGGQGPWGEVIAEYDPIPGAGFLGGAESLFVYFDFDVNGTAGSDTAVSLIGGGFGPPGMHIRDGGTTIDAFAFPDVDRQVTPFPDLRDALNDAGLTNLDGSGLPFVPGDFTGAWQGPLPDPGGGFAVNRSIFVDGFEFGNTSAWSSQVPP